MPPSCATIREMEQIFATLSSCLISGGRRTIRNWHIVRRSLEEWVLQCSQYMPAPSLHGSNLIALGLNNSLKFSLPEESIRQHLLSWSIVTTTQRTLPFWRIQPRRNNCRRYSDRLEADAKCILEAFDQSEDVRLKE